MSFKWVYVIDMCANVHDMNTQWGAPAGECTLPSGEFSFGGRTLPKWADLMEECTLLH